MLNANEMKKNLVTEQSLADFTDRLSTLQADKLYKDGMIQQNALVSLVEDMDVFDTFFSARMENQQMRALKSTNPETFRAVIALQSFGAGMLTAFRQREEGKLITEFSDAELSGFKKFLLDNDPYMILCQILEAEPGSDDKKYLDSVALCSIPEAGNRLDDNRYLEAFAHVLFHTGITLATE